MFASAAEALRDLIQEMGKHPLIGPNKFTIGWSSGSMTNGIKYCIVQVGCPDGEYHIEASGDEADELERQAKQVSSQLAKFTRLSRKEILQH